MLVWVGVHFPYRWSWSGPCAQGEGNKGQRVSKWLSSPQEGETFSVYSLPTYSQFNTYYPHLPTPGKDLFLPNLKSPGIQHRTAHDSRGGHCLHTVFLPSTIVIKNPQCPWVVEHTEVEFSTGLRYGSLEAERQKQTHWGKRDIEDNPLLPHSFPRAELAFIVHKNFIHLHLNRNGMGCTFMNHSL